MLKANERFFAPGGSIPPGGPSTWYLVDWDQRRLVSVTMDEELDTEDQAIEHLQKHIDNLEPNIFEIRVSSDGKLLSTSTDSENDNHLCPLYPPLKAAQSPASIQIVSRPELEELDRLGPLVDLVRCLRSPDSSDKLVFKYFFIYQRLPYVWREMNIWMRLPKHPNIVPFDSIVVDELEGRCVGFTVKYIPGGTLEENKSRVFKLKWLMELLGVIDELNLNLGIIHQDVAPRNLVINDITDSLQIFDFNFSARIGEEGCLEARNDVDGVLFTMYELITLDDKPRSVQHKDQNIAEIERKEWVKHPDVQLDSPVSDFRQALEKWARGRREGKQVTTYQEAPNYIDWPDIPEPEPVEVTVGYTPDGPVKAFRPLWFYDRKRMSQMGMPVLNWERPAQSWLKPGDRLLETGQFLQRAGDVLSIDKYSDK